MATEAGVAVIEIPYTKSMVEFIGESLERTKTEWEENGELLRSAQSGELSPAANQRRAQEYKNTSRNNKKLNLRVVDPE